MIADAEFVHRLIPSETPEAPTLLLLHGTGGDENDLLPIGPMIARGAALLSPRGKVMEGGMPRFFRRLAEGVFDHADVERRTEELADFAARTQAAHGLALPIAVGFSNGANIAAAILHRRPEVLSGAILFRAMLPLPYPPRTALTGKRILIVSGATDPIIPAHDAAALAERLRAAGADVRHEILATGHGLTRTDIDLAREWMKG
jgi:phospholipase/carboxylesterase